MNGRLIDRLRLLGATAVALTALGTVLGSAPVSAEARPAALPADAAADGDTAAARYGWGAPLPQWSDEFGYGSEADPAAPDPAKWEEAGEGGKCWPGNAGNGRRCARNTRVVGGVLRQVGEADGDTGWLASRYAQRYGRWEARVRSRVTGGADGGKYHPLLILWPLSNRWPQDGEYDYLENDAPGEQCAKAYLHYPHDKGVPVQQEYAEKCGVDLTQWHNIAIEWTPDHVEGFVDGVMWFEFSGGADSVRRCIQCAPAMQQTIQLDSLSAGAMQSAVYEVDWVRIYTVPQSVPEPASAAGKVSTAGRRGAVARTAATARG